MWLPPDGDRVSEFNIAEINNIYDADNALAWLRDKILSMENQIKFRRMSDYDKEVWLPRVELALERTKASHQRVQVLRGQYAKQDRIRAQHRLERVFMDTVLEMFDPDDVAEIWEEVYNSHPELEPSHDR